MTDWLTGLSKATPGSLNHGHFSLLSFQPLGARDRDLTCSYEGGLKKN